jgi:putative membrane protein insertion efficiency factor
MPWIRRRRYDPRYDPYYYDDRRSPAGSSCLRDACLLETGCCVAEWLDGNCLVLALPLLPRLLSLSTKALRTGPSGDQRGGLAAAVLASIGMYQQEISSRRAACCRFTPSCSQYAAQAVGEYGAVRGLALAARRLVRCRPGGTRGWDPVPI